MSKMVLKTFSLAVAIFAASVMYLHEFHRDKILYLNNNIPILRSSLSTIHNFLSVVNEKLPFFTPSLSPQESERLFSANELLKFDGESGSPGIYLAIFGKVYDVSKGSKHYGPGGSYHAFAGQDASRSFVTGDFSKEGLTDDVIGLSPDDVKSIQDWSQFYHEQYLYKGKLIGRYYNSKGERTPYYEEVQSLIQQALENSAAQNADNAKFPPCNVEWSAEHGSRVWCSNRSGGIERDWVGVPRKYYKPGADSYRCACIKVSELKQKKGNIEQYERCPFESDSCHIKG